MAQAISNGHLEENVGLRNSPGCNLVIEESCTDFGNMDENVRRSLEAFSSRTGMPIVKENGQRRYGPPLGFVGCSPPHGSEVFVGRLPRNLFEPELVPVLEKVGRIFEMRLMVNLNGSNRGYCFVQYYTPEEAERAVKELNNFEIREGWRIGVSYSFSKRNLFIKDLPKQKDEDEIRYLINRLAEGVLSISVPKSLSYDRRIKNRGFCFVEFDSHKSAVRFMVQWYTGKIKVFSNDVIIEWADFVPEPFSIAVSNLSPSTTEEGVFEIFNGVSQNGVVRVNKRHNRAYIYFKSQAQVDLAKTTLNGKLIDGYKIKIKLNTLVSNPMTSRDLDNNLVSPEVLNTSRYNLISSNSYQPVRNDQNSSSRSDFRQHDNPYSRVEFINQNNENAVTMNPMVAFPNDNQVPNFYNFAHQSQMYAPTNALMHFQTPLQPQAATSGVYVLGPSNPSPIYFVPVQYMPNLQHSL